MSPSLSVRLQDRSSIPHIALMAAIISLSVSTIIRSRNAALVFYPPAVHAKAQEICTIPINPQSSPVTKLQTPYQCLVSLLCPLPSHDSTKHAQTNHDHLLSPLPPLLLLEFGAGAFGTSFSAFNSLTPPCRLVVLGSLLFAAPFTETILDAEPLYGVPSLVGGLRGVEPLTPARGRSL